MPSHATKTTASRVEFKEIEAEAEELADSFLLLQILRSMPRVGVRTAYRIHLTVGDFRMFKTVGQLAVYPGIASATSCSGTSIRGEFLSRASHKRIQRVILLGMGRVVS